MENCTILINECVAEYESFERIEKEPRISLASLSDILHERVGVLLLPLLNSLWSIKLSVEQVAQVLFLRCQRLGKHHLLIWLTAPIS